MSPLEIVEVAAITVTIGAIFTNMVNQFLASVPKRIWKWLVRSFTTTIVIDKDDAEFPLITEWILEQPYGKKLRNTRREWSRLQQKHIFAPGLGHHLMTFEDKPILITYSETEEEDASNLQRIMTHTYYRIMTFGRERERIIRFLAVLEKLRKPDDTRQEIMNWRSDYWRYLPSKRKRTMDTVYIDQNIHAEVIKLIDWFMKNEEWYMIRGIPYRLGISLEGPPGTGKTTYATALAGIFNKPICIMNLASVLGDDNLMNAFANASRNAIILVEDADTASVTSSRETGGVSVTSKAAATNQLPSDKEILNSAFSAATTAPTGTATKEEEKKSLSLGGLLNAIDGVAASEGRILIMTTNYPERLDPALVRSGRIDKRVFIGNLPADEVERMFVTFFPDNKQLAKSTYRCALNIAKPCAWWQEKFIQYQDRLDNLFTELNGIAGTDEQEHMKAGGM